VRHVAPEGLEVAEEDEHQHCGAQDPDDGPDVDHGASLGGVEEVG
jgi:hypothetical protein